jgi:hypothetical protein
VGGRERTGENERARREDEGVKREDGRTEWEDEGVKREDERVKPAVLSIFIR